MRLDGYLEYNSGTPDMALQLRFGYSLFPIPSPLEERLENRTVAAVSILRSFCSEVIANLYWVVKWHLNIKSIFSCMISKPK